VKPNQTRFSKPWEIDIAWYESQGWSSDEARALVIKLWTRGGDLDPLREELAERKLKDPVPFINQIFDVLAELIDEDRLIVKPPNGGRPTPPDKFSRDILAAHYYELLEPISKLRRAVDPL
jgi:hypothetical protein